MKLLLFCFMVVLSVSYAHKPQHSLFNQKSDLIQEDSTGMVVDSGFVVAKWKSVSISEYGPWFEFETKKGKTIHFTQIEPGYNIFDENSPYLIIDQEPGVAFPQIQIKEEVKDKYYKLFYIVTLLDEHAIGELSRVKIVKKITEVPK